MDSIDLTTFITSLPQKLRNLTPEVLLGLVVVVICYVLKFSRFPNRFIPIVCLALPAAVYPLLVTATAPEGIRSPVLRDVAIGILIGAVGWGVHNKLLKRWLDKSWFPEDPEDDPEE